LIPVGYLVVQGKTSVGQASSPVSCEKG